MAPQLPGKKALGGAHLLLIGCGSMGGSLLKGWLASPVLGFSIISVVTPRESSVRPFLSDPRVTRYESPESLKAPSLRKPDTLVYAAKPHMADSILPEYKDLCTPATTFISVAAGKPISHYRSLLGDAPALVRVMPNTPSSVSQGTSLLVCESEVPLCEASKKVVTQLMDAVGKSHWLPSEDAFDRATLLSGCGPAYVFALVEALQKAGESLELSPSLSRSLTLETFSGALAYLQKSPRSAEELRQEVTSPGGVTQAALDVLLNKKMGLEALFKEAFTKGYARTLEMREDE